MIGYRDYTDASLQPPEDPSEEAFILAEEKIVELKVLAISILPHGIGDFSMWDIDTAPKSD